MNTIFTGQLIARTTAYVDST